MEQKKKITRRKTPTAEEIRSMKVTDNIPEGGRLNIPSSLIMQFFKKEIIEKFVEKGLITFENEEPKNDKLD